MPIPLIGSSASRSASQLGRHRAIGRRALQRSSRRGYRGFIDEMQHFEAKMSSEECRRIVTKLECRHNFPAEEPVPVKAFYANQCAVNRPVEDRWSASRSCFSPGLVMGVFDGHAGPACAHTISQTLPDYMFTSVMDGSDLEAAHHSVVREAEKRVVTEPLLHPQLGPLPPEVLEVHSTNLRRFIVEHASTVEEEEEIHYNSAFSLAFSRLDSDLQSAAYVKTADSINFPLVRAVTSGCVATVAFLRGKELCIAQVGDSAAVMGQMDAEGHLVARKMTQEHNSSNVSEVSRLLRSHPVSESSALLVGDRLFGELVPLRTFGNIRYKWPSAQLRETAVLLGVPPSYQIHPRQYKTPPYLTALPELTEHRLSRRDRFLIIASDGLWDMLSPGEAVQVVQAALSETDPNVNPATKLILTALGGSVHSVDYRRVAVMLSISGTVARNYRDDITVVVVEFDESRFGAT